MNLAHNGAHFLAVSCPLLAPAQEQACSPSQHFPKQNTSHVPWHGFWGSSDTSVPSDIPGHAQPDSF